MNPPMPEDIRPTGDIVVLGAAKLKAEIVGYIYCDTTLKGWGYVMRWYRDKSAGTFWWPHNCDYFDSVVHDLHPLEQLGLQAE